MTTREREGISPPGYGLCLDRLGHLGRRQLRELHDQGEVPALSELDGRADGLVLTVPVVRELRLWRGKVFSQGPGGVSGYNRLGISKTERLRYRFEARIARSRFQDREVILLDHDNAENPSYIRAFHDELVRIDAGLFLATSHWRIGGRVIPVCYFALQLPT